MSIGSDLVVHLMACVSHHSTFFRKGFERVPGNKESSFYIIFGKELQEATDAHSASENS